MNAFAAAIDAIFEDPNIGVAAIWQPGGTPPGVAARVLRKSPDAAESFGRTSVVLPTLVLDVRTSEVASPQDGDVVEIGCETFKIIGAPTIDSLGLVWSCEAVQV
jgi:hypothetical protein